MNTMWLKFAQQELEEQENGLPKIDNMSWRSLDRQGMQRLQDNLTWMREYYDENGEEIPHDSKYHKETIIDHIQQVPQQANQLNLFPNQPLLADLLGATAVFHDHWKINTRRPKEIAVCPQCQETRKQPNKCEKCGSPQPIIKTQRHGYNGHEDQGAKDENLFPRLQQAGIPEKYWPQIQLSIKHHLTMHDIFTTLQKGEPISPETSKKWKKIFTTDTGFPLEAKVKLAVGLAIADDLGRDSGDTKKHFDYEGQNLPQLAETLIQQLLSLLNTPDEPPKQKIPTEINEITLQKVHLFLQQQNAPKEVLDATTKQGILSLLAQKGLKHLIPQVLSIIQQGA